MSTQKITNFHRNPNWTDVQQIGYKAQSETVLDTFFIRNLDATQGGFLYLRKLRVFFFFHCEHSEYS